MNLTSSHPFWSVNNGLPSNYPSLQRDVSCDAGVIHSTNHPGLVTNDQILTIDPARTNKVQEN